MKRKTTSKVASLESVDQFRRVKVEEAALLMGWSLRTLERRSREGTGPKITRTGPRSRSVQLGEIRRCLDEFEAKAAAA